ncbi:MAG TPA: hypothetical protein VGD66_02075 [Allosphingosinicella sp.]
MTPARARPKCFLLALLLAWVVAVFLSSALIALAHLSPLAQARRFPASVWAVADEVGPAAKLAFVLLLAPLLLLAEALAPPRLRAALAILLACAAMLLALALVPAAWSRGFGIGLTGARFDPSTLPIYLGSAALAGLSFSLSLARCGALLPR